ncbi:hypothetical protein ICW_02216 [Bacillus wiedmannii]|nr:hypothetical protein ICW_02216 [Bacillus wiedmannii]EJV62554.1 hypothetical protein IEO_02932 [Bacillus wiedmannii]OFD04094.1 hypothetical protein BTGOE6_28080 [Bacillus wiedmannii]
MITRSVFCNVLTNSKIIYFYKNQKTIDKYKDIIMGTFPIVN